MTPTESAEAEVVLRPASREDLAAVAEVYLAARRQAEESGAMPPAVHPPAEARSWVTGWDLGESEVWLAEPAGRVADEGVGALGFVRLTADWLDDLYVAPAARRRGIGAALLALAAGLRPGGFGLWVFQSNLPARALYAAHGLVEVETTDGSGNEEGAPDVLMRWAPVHRGE